MILPLQQAGALYINGAFVAPGEGHEDPVLNPATEEVIAMAPYGSGLADGEAADCRCTLRRSTCGFVAQVP